MPDSEAFAFPYFGRMQDAGEHDINFAQFKKARFRKKQNILFVINKKNLKKELVFTFSYVYDIIN